MSVKVRVKKTKVEMHQRQTSAGTQRPWLMVRLMRTTGGIVTLRAEAKETLKKKKSHQQTKHQCLEQLKCLAY